jgi:hypothetical protein
MSVNELTHVEGVASLLQSDQEFAILTFKVKNTGEGDFDTEPLTQAEWTGEDGMTATAGYGYIADDQDAVHYADFASQPDPGPGGYAIGSTVLVIPSIEPGTLHFADQGAPQTPLFDVATSGSS